MKILLLGSGGREHALAWKIAQSKQCKKLFIAPGNPGTSALGENVNIGVNEFDKQKTQWSMVSMTSLRAIHVQ